MSPTRIVKSILAALVVAPVLLVGLACSDNPSSPASTPASAAKPGDESDRLNRELHAAAERWSSREACSVFMLGTKIGFSVKDASLAQTDWGLCFRDCEESFMRVSGFGADEVMNSTEEEFYSLEDEGRLVAYRKVEVVNGRRTVMSGEMRDGLFEMRTVVAGQTVTRRFPQPRHSLKARMDLERWVMSDASVGSTFDGWATDFGSQDCDRHLRITLRSKSEVADAGFEELEYEYESVCDGATMRMRSRGSKVLWMELEGLIQMKPEPEAQARKMDGAVFDMTELSILPVFRSMGESSERLARVELEIHGIGSEFLPPESDRQIVERISEDACRVVLMRDAEELRPEPLSEDERRRYLSDAPGIESDTETIRARAAEVTEGADTVLGRIARLQEWVHQGIEGDYGGSSDSALEILEHRTGDCTEYTRLFVALARAAGIPAREVSGAMYGDIGVPCFIGHAWAQAHDGERWIDVDPAWNQVGIDAGHVCLSVDENDQSWIRVFGSGSIVIRMFSTEE